MKEGSHKKVQKIRMVQNGQPYLSVKKISGGQREEGHGVVRHLQQEHHQSMKEGPYKCFIRGEDLWLCLRITFAITRNVAMFTSARSPHLHTLSLSQCRRSAMTRSVIYLSEYQPQSHQDPQLLLVTRIRIADDLRISDEQECVVIRHIHSDKHDIYCTACKYISVSSPE